MMLWLAADRDIDATIRGILVLFPQCFTYNLQPYSGQWCRLCVSREGSAGSS